MRDQPGDLPRCPTCDAGMWAYSDQTARFHCMAAWRRTEKWVQTNACSKAEDMLRKLVKTGTVVFPKLGEAMRWGEPEPAKEAT